MAQDVKSKLLQCGARYGFEIFMFVGFIEMYLLKKRSVKEMKQLTEKY